MRVLILGYGYTGRRLGDRLLNDGHEIIGTVTDLDELDESISSKNLQEFRLGENDIRETIKRDEWETGPSFSLIFTAGPPRMDPLSDSLNLLENFLEDLPYEQIKNFVYLGSTSVYGDRNGEWVDESAELDPISRSGRLKTQSERMIRESLPETTPWILVRPGGIYGPGRNSAERYLSEDYELVGGGEKWTNRIHVEDLARICKLACGINENEILNAVDGNPVRLRELVEFLYEETGRNPENITNISWEEAEAKYSEMKLGLLKPSKRVSAKKLRNKYDFDFLYPTVYDGLKELLDDSNH